VDYLLRQLEQKYTIVKERKFQLKTGLLKRDILIKKDSSAIEDDAQVVGESTALDRAHQAKITKYKVLEKVIKDKYSVENVVFTSLTLSSRGIWSG